MKDIHGWTWQQSQGEGHRGPFPSVPKEKEPNATKQVTQRRDNCRICNCNKKTIITYIFYEITSSDYINPYRDCCIKKLCKKY